jgi:signal transduction histidine kinase/ligand-binding sensor domain-containing protein
MPSVILLGAHRAALRSGFVLAALCWSLLPFSLSGLSAGPEARQDLDVWPVDQWSQGTVSSILQTRDGYLWLGTYHGLARYDGVRFTSFHSGNTSGLCNSRITSLYQARDETLWIGHETGDLTRYSRGIFYPVTLGSNWIRASIEAIAEDSAHDLWLLNTSGLLYRLRDGHTASCPGTPSPSRKPVLSRQNNGTLWILLNGQLARIQDGVTLPVQLPGFSDDAYHQVAAPARDGGMWIMTGGRVRKWHDDTSYTDFGDCPCGPTAGNIMLETASGTLVVGTINDGIYLLHPAGPPLHFARTHGLSHNWIRSLTEDHEGNIWIGTGAGIDTLRPRKVRMLTPPDGFAGCAAMSLAQTHDGSFWVATEGAGIYRLQAGAWSTHAGDSGLSNDFVWSLLETREGQLLAGTWGGGLNRWNGVAFSLAEEFSEITAAIVSLYHARNGHLWIGTTLGLYRFTAGKLTCIAGPDELTLPDVRTITETSDGTLWFGMSGGGLGSLRNGALKQYRQSDGLLSDFVQALYAETNGTLWIGTSDAGLGRFKNGRFSAVTTSQGLPSDVITHILDDLDGNLWLGTHQGICRITKNQLEGCADGVLRTITPNTYGKAEGLITPTCSGGFQPGAFRSSDGLLRFPTARGVACIDPAQVTLNPVPPPVHIEQLIIDGQSAPLADAFSNAPLKIPPGKHRFDLHFTALSFSAPEKVRFKYKLEGLESDWQNAETRSVQYGYLRPGDYVFRVIACNNDDVWSPEPATLAFTVLPLFWQTWWFQSLFLLSGAALIAGSVRAVTRRRLRHRLELLERQRALERERARIARDIHDDLGASLTRITLLSQSARSELESHHPAAHEVEQIYGTARELTRAMDEIVWAVNPKHDTLDSLVTYLGRFAQTFLSSADLRCRLDVPVSLPCWALTSEIRHNLFLALKEALHNIVKHAKATEVRVSLDLNSAGFELSITDNGRGFSLDPSHTQPDGNDSYRLSGGNGMNNMRRRLHEISGLCQWHTTPGEGARVTFTVPVSHS